MKAEFGLKASQIPLPILKASLALSSYVMALPLNELKEYVNKIYSENPLLEEKNQKVASFDFKKNEIFSEREKKEKYLSNLVIEKSSNYLIKTNKSTHDVMSETLKEKKSFIDIFEEQLNFYFLSDFGKKKIGHYFLGEMDQFGFLTENKIAQAEEKFGEAAWEVLKIIQTFEPAGIGAVDIKECLLIQLKNKGKDYSIEKKIIQDHYKLFLKKDEKTISKLLQLPIQKIKQAIERISFLEFNPKRNYFNNIYYLYPEVKVREVEGKFSLMINDDEIPEIVYNNQYEETINQQKKNNLLSHNKELVSFINEKKIEAKNIIFSLRFRIINLVKIMGYILELQKDFFLLGKKYLKPDTITNAAKQLNVDISTISRIVNQKYIDTKWGIVPLKFFFSSRNINLAKKGAATKTVSSLDIQLAIKEIIKSSKVQLSDQKITNILQAKGIKVARRTINKYRNKMNLLSSYERYN